MDAKAINLQSLLNAPKQFLIPVFQRYYSWKQENWQQLWDDIEALFDQEQQLAHFMGSLVFIPVLPPPIDGNPQYQVIDGQQRLMTLTLLICAVRYHAAQHKQQALEAEIHRYYLIHEFRQGYEHYRVYPRQRDRDLFLSAIDTPSTEIEGQVGEALKFFIEHIALFIESDPPSRLRTLFDHLKSRLDFVYVQLDTENPYEIFKSLNSTGVPLSEADLIRNFVFMHVDVQEQNHFDDTYWRPFEAHFEYKSGEQIGELNVGLATRFFRDFLMKSGEYVRSNAVFATFESRYGSKFDPVTLTKELTRNAEYYDVLRGIESHKSTAVSNSLNKLQKLDTSTVFPLLLALWQKAEESVMSEDELRTAIELLAGFILRRYATNQSSRAYGRWFVSACKDLKDKPLIHLNRYLQGKGFPNDKQFETGFATFPWYIRSYAYVILEALERSIPNKEPADLTNVSIEHIMPQTLTDEWLADLGSEAERVYEEWLHTIGNLTLSGYNPELRNYAFTVKRQLYDKSGIQLNRQLAKLEKWTEKQIKERGSQLARVASKMWIGSLELEQDKVKDELVAQEQEDEQKNLTETQQLQLDYWDAFMQYVDAQGSVVKTRKPHPQGWSDFAIGRSDFSLLTYINSRDRRIGVQLVINGLNAKTYYHMLYRDKNAIEKEMGVSLNWWELQEKISSYIDLHTKEFDIQDRSHWPTQHAWLCKWLEAFYHCFAQRIKTL